jgi:hypothetical protein
MTEAQWLFQEALRRRQIGDEAGARKIWQQLLEAFGPVRSERPWVRRAREELDRAPGETTIERRLDPVIAAAKRVKELRAAGKADEADAASRALQELYGNDKQAREIIKDK